MSADLSDAQSTAITQFRNGCKGAITTLSALDQTRVKALSLGGFDAFVAGAFLGNNKDLAAADLDAANTSLLKLRAILYDTSGNPTQDLLNIIKVSQ